MFEELLRGVSTPPNSDPPSIDDATGTPVDGMDQVDQVDQFETADEVTVSGIVIDRFPFGSAGAPTPGKDRGASAYESLRDMHADNPWAPFSSKLDWEVAQWAKTHRLTSTSVAELLAIPGVRVGPSPDIIHLTQERKVVEALGLSFHTVKELNARIDDEIPEQPRPPFLCEEVTFGDERLDFHYRDVMQSIRAVYGDPEFAQELVFAPEKHYTDQDRECRIYNEMHTGDWWWKVQVSKY
jgi:hypothetical protein